MPDTRALYKELRAKGFEVLGVSLDKTENEAKGGANGLRLPWRHLFNGIERSGPHTSVFRVNGIPDAVLFDRAGRVRAIGLRGIPLEEKVRRLLAENPESRKG